MRGKIGLSVLIVVLALVLLVSGASSISADSGSATYIYLIETDTAMASNGDTITLTGFGTLSIHPKSVTGGGTFTHMDAAGNVLGSGTWTATQLLSFNGYGCGGDGLPDDFCGGRANISVHLSSGFDAVLQIDCVIGSPPAGAIEGVRLAVQSGPNFNREVSGDNLFILQP